MQNCETDPTLAYFEPVTTTAEVNDTSNCNKEKSSVRPIVEIQVLGVENANFKIERYQHC